MNYQDIILKSTKKTLDDLGQDVGIGGEDTTGMTPINYTDTAIVKYQRSLLIDSGEYITDLKDNVKFIMLKEVPVNSFIGFKDCWYKVKSVDNTIENIYTMYTEYFTKTTSVVYTLEINNTSPLELNVNSEVKLDCTCKCDDKIVDNPVLKYSCNNDNCTIDSDGTIHGVKSGSSVISVTYNGITKTIDVNVHDVYTIECADVNALDTDGTVQLAPTLKKNGAVFTDTLTYSSNNTSVITVSDLGLITIVAVGNTTIDISYGNYVTKTINVTIAKDDIYTIECDNITVDKGSNIQLAPICKKNGVEIGNPTINYTVADSSIANISSDGIVTGLSVGNTTITMTYEGVTTTINVTVNDVAITYTIEGQNPVLHKKNYIYTLKPSNPNCVWELDEIDVDCTANIVSQTHDSVVVYAMQTLSTDYFTLYAKDGDKELAKLKVTIKHKL